jgi:hypothetical protein
MPARVARGSPETSPVSNDGLAIRDRELTLLLACLRQETSIPAVGNAPLPAEAVDWERFVAWVERHGVGPLLHRALRQASESYVPPAVRHRVQEAAGLNARVVLLQIAEARRLIDAFARVGIRSLAIKGPVLAEAAFGDPTARASRDVDLLIDPERVSEADRLMMDAGYRRVDPGFELTPRQFERYRRVRCQYGYRSRQSDLRVELHWRLTSNPRLLTFDDAALWSRPDRVSVAGVEFATLPRDELFLYLCVHGSTHVWFRLISPRCCGGWMARNSRASPRSRRSSVSSGRFTKR